MRGFLAQGFSGLRRFRNPSGQKGACTHLPLVSLHEVKPSARAALIKMEPDRLPRKKIIKSNQTHRTMFTVLEQRFLESVPRTLAGIEKQLEMQNRSDSLLRKYGEVKDKARLDRMGSGCPDPAGGRQSLYGDVLDWLRDNGYGKDHDLAALLIGNYAISRCYDGNKNQKID